MEFRPCIDIHNGKVKQIIGSSLLDIDNQAIENHISDQDAAFFAQTYRRLNLKGGHVILLNSPESSYYEETRTQALAALRSYPGGLQVGGGITAENAADYLSAGASHVIATSYVFRSGQISYPNLDRLVRAAGARRLVLDISCRKKNDRYYIVTDRWQKYTDVILSHETLDGLSRYCSEFLVHAVDVEGKSQGIDQELAALLGSWNQIPITYAGGVHSFADLEILKNLGQNRLNVTIGSALDLFGGPMNLQEVLKCCKELP